MKTISILSSVLLLCGLALGQVALFPGAGGYFEDFESGPGAWANSTGSLGTPWQHGTPAGAVINAAHSGSNAFASDLVANYANNTFASLEAQFDLTSYASFGDPIFSMQLWHDSEAGWDGVNIEIDTGSGFTVVGTVGDPNNWYNDTDVDGLANNIHGWSGSSGGYMLVTHALTGAAGNMVTIRINMGTDGSVNGYDGAAVDDIRIVDAPIPVYPGTFEDFEAAYDLNLGGATVIAPGNEVIPVAVGDYLEYSCISPGSTFTGLDLIVVGSSLPTGMPLPFLIAGLHLEPQTAFVVNRAVPGVLPLLPSGGFNVSFVHPGAALSGLSLFLQGVVSTGIASNAIFASTNGIEFQMQ